MKNGIIAAVVLIILAAGGYFFLNKQKMMKSSNSNEASTVAPKPTADAGFSSIQDALSKSLSIKCEYPDPKDDSQKIVTYIKAGSVRVIASKETTGSNIILKDNKMYTWAEGKKDGTIITLDVEAMKEVVGKMQASVSASPEHKPNQKDAMINQMEQYKKYCKQEPVADSFFEVPKDVKFVDFSAQMKQSGFDSKEMMQKMQSQFQKTPPNPPTKQ